MVSSFRIVRFGLLPIAVVACSQDNLGPSAPRTRRDERPSLAVAFDASSMILAAGDIANCSRTQDNGTGDLIRSLLPSYPNAIVAPLGDLVYPYARSSDFTNCYNPAWGSFKSITKPVVGNHEYDSASTAGLQRLLRHLGNPRARDVLLVQHRDLAYRGPQHLQSQGEHQAGKRRRTTGSSRTWRRTPSPAFWG